MGSPEALWELNLAENRLTAQGVEELLRCLYNHPRHPPKLPAPGGTFALRLDLRGNYIEDSEAMCGRIEAVGGPTAVKIVRTAGDGPPPTPCTDPHQPSPYLWVFLPRLAEQTRAIADAPNDRKDRNEKRADKKSVDRKDRHERTDEKKSRDRKERRDRSEDKKDSDRKERKEKKKNEEDEREKEKRKAKEKDKDRDKDKEKKKKRERDKEKDRDREDDRSTQKEKDDDKDKEKENEHQKNEDSDRKERKEKKKKEK